MWRDRDRFAGTVIDSAGELPDGTAIKGPMIAQGAAAPSDQFVQTLPRGCWSMRPAARTLGYDDNAYGAPHCA